MESIKNGEYYLNKINDFKKKIPKYKNNFNNKGIIICINDSSFISSIICIENIIKNNPLINIECYYCENELFEYQKKYILNKYNNINLINCLDKIPNWYPNLKNMKEHMIKLYALLITSFSDVLLLDSYIIPILNIDELFNNSNYIKYGNIFWKDLTNNLFDDKLYKLFNINKPDIFTDYGQILININKCWDAICLAYYFNNELFNSNKDLYYIAFKLTNTFYYQNNYNPIPCTCEGNKYSSISSIIQRYPNDGSDGFINRSLSKININNYLKIIYIYDDAYIVDKDIKSLENKYSKINKNIKKVDIFNIIILSKLKEYLFINKNEIINNCNNIIQNNIIYLNYNFKLVDPIKLEETLNLLNTYTKYNIFHLNSLCIFYSVTLRFTEAYMIINNIYENKINNNESLLILIYIYSRINFNLDNFNLIIKLLNDHDLFIFLFQLLNNKRITINIINNVLLPKKNIFYDNFIKIFNFDNIDELNNNFDKLLSNENIIPKFNIPIYFNKFYMLSFKNNNNLDIKQKLSKLNRLLFPCLNYIKPQNNFIIKKNKKIGFISTNLRLHSVGRDRIGIICNLNQDLFDINVYHFNEYSDDIYFNLLKKSNINNIILKGGFNNWIKVIENDNLDIIIYPDIGIQEETYLLAHTRLAPIQITTFGHSESSGINTIDYYLSSELYEVSEYKEHYSEKVILQKSLGTFYYDCFYDFIKNFRNNNISFLLDNEKLYITNLQYLHKNSDNDYLLYKKILNQNKLINIIFVNGTDDKIYQDKLIKNLSEYINRIVILPKLNTSDYYKLITKSYLILDTYPHGGCNTSLESFYYNKIVITFPSKYLRGRFTYGFYKKMGIDDAIVYSIDEYVEKINFFINNPNEKNKVEELININKHKLFNDLESIHEWNTILFNITI